jgi:hypothetical protein
MKAIIPKHVNVRFIAGVILLSAIGDVFAQSRDILKLNDNAFAFAAQLIRKGRVVIDRKGAWAKDRPSPEAENAFIRLNGFGEYAKWHLAIDKRFPENTKRRYKFPYGDFKNVHRCGVLAVQSRANEHGYAEIENAAAKLREMLEATRNAMR